MVDPEPEENEMRRHVEELTETDRRVLRGLADTEWVLSPVIIAENIGRSRHYVSSRLALLAKADLVEKVEEGRYRVTDLGVCAVEGDLSEDEAEAIGDALRDED